MTHTIDVLTPAEQPGSWRVATSRGATYLLTSDDERVTVTRFAGDTSMRMDATPLEPLVIGYLDERGRVVEGQVRIGSPMVMVLPPLAAGVVATARSTTPVVAIEPA